MRNVIRLSFFLVFAIVVATWVTSCEKPTDPDYSNKYDDRGGSFVPTTALVTFKASQVAATEAWSGGSFENTYGPSVIKKGVCWSTSAGPTINANCTDQGTGHTQFSSKLEPLAPGTAYFIRAYAVHEGGAVVYGNQEQLTTLALPTVTTTAVTGVTARTATAGGNVTIEGSSAVTARGVCYATSQNPTTASTCMVAAGTTGGFTLNLTGLDPSTTYFVRAYATNANGTAYGNQVSFTTSAPSPPSVTTAAVTGVGTTTATAGGNVTGEGSASVTARGVCYATSQNPTTANSCFGFGAGPGEFTVILTGLSVNTTYYVRAYATNAVGTSYGAQVTFTTSNPQAPTLTTSAISNVSFTTATSGGNITAGGSAVVTARGVCYATTQNPTISNNCVSSGSGNGSFIANFTGLNPGTTYYVRAYATNVVATSYGNQVSFTTSNPQVPTVTTSVVSSVAVTTATAGGNVTSGGSSAVIARGVCYATTQNPTTSGQCTNITGGEGSFTSILTGLTSGTTYYVRAYATNAAGTAYGNQVTFTTQSLPDVSTTAVTNIGTTTVTAGGNVTAAGSSTVTVRGVCYATTPSPTTANQCVSAGNGIGSFTANITGLFSNSTYYLRAYATNSAGTSYGNQVSFKTEALAAPTVLTGTITNITTTSATVTGEVIDLGSFPVTGRGVCFATTQNPSISSQCVSSGSGIGSFTVNLTGLSQSTTYYVRAYATNSAGTNYGAQLEFRTETQSPLPTVTTSVSNITSTSATATGNVTSVGTSLVNGRGLCYATTQNPTLVNNCTFSGSGLGNFSINLSNLQPGTTYYVRAYATNSSGTAYGNQVTFTTLGAQSVLPTVTTSAVNNIGTNTATASGSVTDPGSSSLNGRGFCYATNQNPTLSDNCVGAGNGLGSFTANITGLSSGTTYYLRAYATNSTGTAYGNQTSFTTQQSVNTTPSVTTEPIVNFASTTATAGGDVTSSGGSAVTARGVCYSTNQNPTTSNQCIDTGTGLGSFSVMLTSLVPGTMYFVRAYATNSSGTAYGNQVSFTTLSPSNSAPIANDDTYSTAFNTNLAVSAPGILANDVDDGGVANLQAIIVTAVPSNAGTASVAANGSFTYIPAIGYAGNVVFTYRARDAQGLTSNIATVTITVGQGTPSVTTATVTNIASTTATAGGNVTAAGSSAVTARGVCYATSQNPTTSNQCTSNGSGTGSFTASLSGLTGGTLYYVRAYATNAAGTSYGSQVSFTSITPATPPTVTTATVTSIATTTATAGGNVTDAGSSTVTARGVCYATTQNPTTSNQCVSSGSGTSNFTASLSGLTGGTLYYVRAYATNASGTSYGNQVSFTTLTPATPPTITTAAVTSIATTTATAGGNVTDTGSSAVTARGVCYATTQNPTTSNQCVSTGSGTGSFTASLSGLTGGTLYYVRAYATNAAGTSYGSQVSFTTQNLTGDGKDNTTAVVNVTNPTTGRIWMDRNLGASRAAISSTDAEAFGDLYQWGRRADGHEKRNSPTTTTLSTTDQPNHGSFILSSSGFNDWRSPGNSNLWQGVNGVNNPCPAGYRLPTAAEWQAEKASWNSTGGAGAIASPLKLPLAGGRSRDDGSVYGVFFLGFYYSSSAEATASGRLSFNSDNSSVGFGDRAGGVSVRCIKN